MEGFQGDYIYEPDQPDTGYDSYADRKLQMNPHTKQMVARDVKTRAATPATVKPASFSALLRLEPIIHLAAFLAASLMAMIGAFAAGPIGAVVNFIITIVGVAIGAVAISHRSDRASALARDQVPSRPDPWTILIPLSKTRMLEAQHRCNAFLKLAAEVPQTPESATTMVTIQNRLPELVESYSRARRHASPAEVGVLTRNLLDTVEKIGLFADQGRQQLLNPLINDFEANRVFLDGRVGDQELAPIQEKEPSANEGFSDLPAQAERPGDDDEPWTDACSNIPF